MVNYRVHKVSLIPILIFSTHLRLGLPSGLFPSDFPTKILYVFLLPHLCYMPCPAHLILLELDTHDHEISDNPRHEWLSYPIQLQTYCTPYIQPTQYCDPSLMDKSIHRHCHNMFIYPNGRVVPLSIDDRECACALAIFTSPTTSANHSGAVLSTFADFHHIL
jgi:hypothetical protein